ncbi:MAG: undecaprenyl-diphosphate phosphatase [Candidatus Taylorbacteria bacterium]
MLTTIQALILGGFQGISELFPISSLGHSVILPTLFGWRISQSDNAFVIFLVATHLATALVLLGFYYKDWLSIIQGIIRSLKNRVIEESDVYAKLGWLIIVATIPAGILGLLFEDKLKLLFASPRYAALFLIANGGVLLVMELFRARRSQSQSTDLDASVSKLTWKQAVIVGCAQCLALLPGFSRTGMSMGGGLIVGLNHESALRFSFLLATPIIFAAAVLKLPELVQAGNIGAIGPIIVGSIASALTAYGAIRFLSHYFKTKTLKPFAWYCIAFGIISVLCIG